METVEQAVEHLCDKGWTFNAIAQVLGVSRYTASRWFQGTTEPVPTVPILYALRALDQLDVPDWPRPKRAKLPPLTLISDADSWRAVAQC